MKKIELYFGQGQGSVLIDWKKRNCVLYNGTPEFHKEYGGCTYYVSRSGLSCAGWIPNKPYIQVGAGYRTDARMLSAESIKGPFIPFDYRKGNIDYDWPVVFPIGRTDRLPEEVVLESPRNIVSPKELMEDRFIADTFEFHYVIPQKRIPSKETWKVKVYSEQWCSRYRMKTVLIRLYAENMRRPWNERCTPFWSCLGVHPEDNGYGETILYKIGGYGIPIDWKLVDRDILDRSAKEIMKYLEWEIGECELVEENTIAVPTPNGFTLFSRYREDDKERYRMLSPYDEVDPKFWYDPEYQKEVLSRLEQ